MLAVLCAPQQEHVICLEPEFITPQDGYEKQDCEQRAIKRWVTRHAGRFAPWDVTILTDDLHCHQPTCELLLAHQMHFILTCKPESHAAMYEELALLAQVDGAISTFSERKWNGRHYEEWRYRWAEQLPLPGGSDALWVNWCELTIINEATGERLYHNAWATDHALNAQVVMEVVASGRSRWKVENEGINVLKNRGYHFEHNYGHGKQRLAAVLLTMMLLAFLFHTALDLSCLVYQAIRRELAVRRTFFDDLRALTRYIYFDTWQQLLNFMYQQLDTAPEPGLLTWPRPPVRTPADQPTGRAMAPARKAPSFPLPPPASRTVQTTASLSARNLPVHDANALPALPPSPVPVSPFAPTHLKLESLLLYSQVYSASNHAT